MVKNQVSFSKNLSKIKALKEKYKINTKDILSLAEQLTPRPFNSRISILSLGDTGATIRSLVESLHIDYLPFRLYLLFIFTKYIVYYYILY